MLWFCETCTPPDFCLMFRCWQRRDGGAESGRQWGGGEVEGPAKSQRRGVGREKHRIHNSHSSWAAAGHHAGGDKHPALINHLYALNTLSYSNILWSQDWDTCVCVCVCRKQREIQRRSGGRWSCSWRLGINWLLELRRRWVQVQVQMTLLPEPDRKSDSGFINTYIWTHSANLPLNLSQSSTSRNICLNTVGSSIHAGSVCQYCASDTIRRVSCTDVTEICIEPWVKYRDTNESWVWCIITVLIVRICFSNKAEKLVVIKTKM